MTDAAGWLRRAERLLERRQLNEERAAFDRAEMLGADADRCSAGRWMAAMLVGEYESAWRESDGIRSAALQTRTASGMGSSWQEQV